MQQRKIKITVRLNDEEYRHLKTQAINCGMIRSRVKSGMAKARAKGRAIGRPQTTKDDIPTNFLKHYPAYKNKQLNLSELARVCGLSRTTVYKYLELLEA